MADGIAKFDLTTAAAYRQYLPYAAGLFRRIGQGQWFPYCIRAQDSPLKNNGSGEEEWHPL